MDDAYGFRFKRLDVYRLAVDHFEWTCRVVDRMPRGPFKVTNQAVGASLSIMGNIGEANGRDRKPREVQQHYRYALGSTFEAAMLRSPDQRLRRQAQRAKRLRERAARHGSQRITPGTPPQRQSSTPRASGVPASPKGAAGIDPGPRAVPQGAQRPPGIDPREAGPRGSAATERDRPSPQKDRYAD